MILNHKEPHLTGKTDPTTLYLVRMSDGRIKFGISACVQKRLTYYVQEARRNGVECMTWYAVKSFKDRATAIQAETALRRASRQFVMFGQREWLRGVTFGSVIAAVDSLRDSLAHEEGLERQGLPWCSSYGHIKTGVPA